MLLYSGTIPESTTKAIAIQQKFLESLARVVLNNKTDLDYLLAEQGGVCVVAKSLTILGLWLLRKLRLSYIKKESGGLRK